MWRRLGDEADEAVIESRERARPTTKNVFDLLGGGDDANDDDGDAAADDDDGDDAEGDADDAADGDGVAADDDVDGGDGGDAGAGAAGTADADDLIVESLRLGKRITGVARRSTREARTLQADESGVAWPDEALEGFDEARTLNHLAIVYLLHLLVREQCLDPRSMTKRIRTAVHDCSDKLKPFAGSVQRSDLRDRDEPVYAMRGV